LANFGESIRLGMRVEWWRVVARRSRMARCLSPCESDVANHAMFAVEAVAARCPREAQMRSAVIGKSSASQEEMR